ncbi:hypothetical protein ScPMuIL_005416 [Solemya velum]
MGLDNTLADCDLTAVDECFIPNPETLDIPSVLKLIIDNGCPIIWTGLVDCMSSLIGDCADDNTYLNGYGVIYKAVEYICVDELTKFNKHFSCLATKSESAAVTSCVAAVNAAHVGTTLTCGRFDGMHRCYCDGAAECGAEARDIINGLFTPARRNLAVLSTCPASDVTCSGMRYTTWLPLLLLCGIPTLLARVF